MDTPMTFRRYEYKYLLTCAQRDRVLQELSDRIQPDSFGHSLIRNIYYDTPTYRLIRDSLERPVYKEKLRLRGYGPEADGQPVYIELKKKYDSIVYKRRIRLPREQALLCLSGAQPLPDSQVGREIGHMLRFYSPLRPAVYLNYQRDAFWAPETEGFRLTFDDDICFRRADSALPMTRILPEDTVLMELKLPGSMPIWMAHLLSRENIHKTTFSKYGTAYQMLCRNTKGETPYAEHHFSGSF